MKFLIIITLFFVCATFIAFSKHIQSDNAVIGVSDLKMQKFFTQYNSDLKNNGIMKSAFRHEMVEP